VKYLLDTNPCIVYLRGKNPLVQQRMAAQAPGEVVLCSITTAELYFGAEKGNNPLGGKQQVDAFVAPFLSLPFDERCVGDYARLRADLEIRGLPIDENDYLIAAIALAHNLVLVTHNTLHFSRIPGLQLEDWEIP